MGRRWSAEWRARCAGYVSVHDALRSQQRGGLVIERSLYLAQGVAMLRQRFYGDDARSIIKVAA
jgi:hypothetical protein